MLFRSTRLREIEEVREGDRGLRGHNERHPRLRHRLQSYRLSLRPRREKEDADLVLYFLNNDLKLAEQFSDLAIQHDRYNSKALVNKGNCLFINEDYDRAKEFFLEAIGVEADCIEAIYNLGLVYKRLGYYNEIGRAHV